MMNKWKQFISGLLCACLVAMCFMPVSGASAKVSAAEIPATEKEYLIEDNSYDLALCLANHLGDATAVKINCSNLFTGQTVLPAQIHTLVGWNKNFWGDDNETVRTVKGTDSSDTLTFAARTDVITIKSIAFEMLSETLVIPAGVTVRFENCSFKETIVNEGSAVFDNCTFVNETIKNDGSAQYTNGTQEPKNIGVSQEERDEAAAQKVMDAINALPAVKDVTKEDKAAVAAAQAAYDALTDDQKALVSDEAKQKLADIQKALNELPDDQKLTIDDMKDITNQNIWFYSAVAWCMENGLFQGDNNKNFNPQNNITRAEFAQMLYNYYKNDEMVMKDGSAITFPDVNEDDWYYEAVMACGKAKIFVGDDTGGFLPNTPIRRQDAALVIMRIAIGQDAIDLVDIDSRLEQLKDKGYTFTDFQQTSKYAQKAMAAAAGEIFFGDHQKRLLPQSAITRAEAAQMMYNYLK
ncbi:MAG: S-layer homology domain-containing protein [Bacillota bacterium]|nr:S-layer homology domain-containing protein [Bacillota bacterium]